MITKGGLLRWWVCSGVCGGWGTLFTCRVVMLWTLSFSLVLIRAINSPNRLKGDRKNSQRALFSIAKVNGWLDGSGWFGCRSGAVAAAVTHTTSLPSVSVSHSTSEAAICRQNVCWRREMISRRNWASIEDNDGWFRHCSKERTRVQRRRNQRKSRKERGSAGDWYRSRGVGYLFKQTKKTESSQVKLGGGGGGSVWALAGHEVIKVRSIADDVHEEDEGEGEAGEWADGRCVWEWGRERKKNKIRRMQMLWTVCLEQTKQDSKRWSQSVS